MQFVKNEILLLGKSRSLVDSIRKKLKLYRTVPTEFYNCLLHCNVELCSDFGGPCEFSYDTPNLVAFYNNKKVI